MSEKFLIAFDFDGTICDSADVFVEELNRLSKYYGYRSVNTDVATMESLRDKTLKELIDYVGVAYWKLPFLVFHANKSVKRRGVEFSAYPGVIETINLLKEKGHTVGVISSNRPSTIRRFLKKTSFEPDFLIGNVGIFSKPKVVSRWASKSHLRSFYVGDETRDIEAAKKAGATSIGVTWGHDSKRLLSQYEPSFLVDDAESLLNVFLKLAQESASTEVEASPI